MLFDPTERNVDPFLLQARIRAVKELLLALAIHDKDVTMAKTAQVSFIIRTGLFLLFLKRMRACVCAQHLYPATATS